MFLLGKANHSLNYGAEPFLRSCQLCSYSGTSQHFMEPEVSFPCSQEPSIGPYSEPDQSSPYKPGYRDKLFTEMDQLVIKTDTIVMLHLVSHPISMRFILILSIRLPLPSGLFGISHRYPICISLRPHSCYMPCASNPP
jgi:hypothetical protein